MGYLTVAEIKIEMAALATGSQGLCTITPFNDATVSEPGFGPTTYSMLTIEKGTGAERPHILIVAGMHAREWAQTDALLKFLKDLMAAYNSGAPFVIPAYTNPSGSTYGPVTVPAASVKKIIDTLTLIVVPMANPDGRAFSQSDPAHYLWRKNRAPEAIAGTPSSAGVDLNRHFDIAWDYDVFYTPAFVASGDLSASKDPTDDRFIGTNPPGPAAQPEVKNLVWILENKPVTWCIDLHCFSELVMYPWGIEQNGSDPAQTFHDSTLDGLRDGTLGTTYSEYFPDDLPEMLLTSHDTIAKAMRSAITAATGRVYTAGGIADTIYPATGSLTDFAFSRQFIIPNAPAFFSFAVEFGDAADNFQPAYSDPHGYPRIEREVHAVLLELLQAMLAPASIVTPDSPICPLSVAVAGLAQGAGWLDALRLARAALLDRRPTAAAMKAVDRAYRRLGPLLASWLSTRHWARRAVAFGLVMPAAGLASLALRAARR